eukprot:3729521-Lingulodinium_polyedra.AAC.1
MRVLLVPLAEQKRVLNTLGDEREGHDKLVGDGLDDLARTPWPRKEPPGRARSGTDDGDRVRNQRA